MPRRKKAKRKPPEHPERRFQVDFLYPVLWANGWMIFHCRDARHADGDEGFFDLVIARRRKVLFVEVKVLGRQLRPEQEKWRAEVPKEQYRLIDRDNPTTLKAFLREIRLP